MDIVFIVLLKYQLILSVKRYSCGCMCLFIAILVFSRRDKLVDVQTMKVKRNVVKALVGHLLIDK